ncbi:MULTISPECIES: hypothetical protein [Aerosakkonema]|uniref:hypothetical protein n=1 Tax=Aerosakkonema TaxID=1246629 RepID=UPI0035B7CB94
MKTEDIGQRGNISCPDGCYSPQQRSIANARSPIPYARKLGCSNFMNGFGLEYKFL